MRPVVEAQDLGIWFHANHRLTSTCVSAKTSGSSTRTAARVLTAKKRR